MAKATAKSVVQAWSERAGKLNQYDVREVTDSEGREQTQLIDKDTGSISVAVDGHGDKALQRLQDNVGAALLDPAVLPAASTSTDNEVQTTSRGVLATPTQPEATNDPADKVVIEENNPAPERSGDVPTHVDPTTGGSAPGERSAPSRSRASSTTAPKDTTGSSQGSGTGTTGTGGTTGEGDK